MADENVYEAEQVKAQQPPQEASKPSDSDSEPKPETIEKALDRAKQLASQFEEDCRVNPDIWNKPMTL